MSDSASPASVVQAQLDAYNARDLESLLGLYAPDAELFEHPDRRVARGADQLRERFSARFLEANLHARLLGRIVFGDFVVDHEEVLRTFADGPGRIPLLMTYEVRAGRIVRAWVLAGSRLPAS